MLFKKIAVFMAVSVLTVSAFFLPQPKKINVSAQAYTTYFDFDQNNFDNSTAYTYFIVEPTHLGGLLQYYFYKDNNNIMRTLQVEVLAGVTQGNLRAVRVSKLVGSEYVTLATGWYPFDVTTVLYFGVQNAYSGYGLSMDMGYIAFEKNDNVWTFTRHTLIDYSRSFILIEYGSKWQSIELWGNNTNFAHYHTITSLEDMYTTHLHFYHFSNTPYAKNMIRVAETNGSSIYVGDYYSGYQQGLDDSDTVQGFIPRLFGAVSYFFLTVLGGISLFGVSLWTVTITLLAVAVVSFFIKFIT